MSGSIQRNKIALTGQASKTKQRIEEWYRASGEPSVSLIDFRDFYFFVKKLLRLDTLIENWDDRSIARGVSRRSRNNHGLDDKCLDLPIANADGSQ